MEGSVDLSVALRLGVYLLRRKGQVVHIGKSRCPLMAIAAHRHLCRTPHPSWFPIRGIQFDSVEVIPAHPDRVDALMQGLSELHLPAHSSCVKPAGSARVSVADPANQLIPRHLSP